MSPSTSRTPSTTYKQLVLVSWLNQRKKKHEFSFDLMDVVELRHARHATHIHTYNNVNNKRHQTQTQGGRKAAHSSDATFDACANSPNASRRQCVE